MLAPTSHAGRWATTVTVILTGFAGESDPSGACTHNQL